MGLGLQQWLKLSLEETDADMQTQDYEETDERNDGTVVAQNSHAAPFIHTFNQQMKFSLRVKALLVVGGIFGGVAAQATSLWPGDTALVTPRW